MSTVRLISEHQRLPSESSTLENDLHKVTNLDVSFGDIIAILHPSAEALAVRPLL